MEKEYNELKEISTSIVGIYLELAKLEKNEKKESREYGELISLLPKALEIEKRKYLSLEIKEKYIEINKDIIRNSKKLEDVLLISSKDVLASLRLLNLIDKEMYYSLLDNTSKEITIHYYLEEVFLYELVKHIHKVEPSEKDMLIDYIYAILASSRTFSIESLNLIQPMFSLNEKDRMAIKLDMFSKLQEINNKLFSLTDIDITKETILLVMYYKASLQFHPYIRNVIEEDRNAIQLMGFFGGCSQVCRLLSLLGDDDIVNIHGRM